MSKSQVIKSELKYNIRGYGYNIKGRANTGCVKITRE